MNKQTVHKPVHCISDSRLDASEERVGWILRDHRGTDSRPECTLGTFLV